MAGNSEETLDDRRQNGDGGENGQKKDKEDGSVGFWNRELNTVRLTVFKKWAITSKCLRGSLVA